MELGNNTFLIAGAGISGIGAANLLTKVGADIILYDGNSYLEKDEIKNKLDAPENVHIILGTLTNDIIGQIDIMVLSPGIAIDTDFVNRARDAGVAIWGEIELAYLNSRGKLAAITGTNGKTTTTALVGEILKNYFKSVYVVGNIGIPYTSIALDTTEESVTVAEISSFQLETIHSFKPNISAVLNITPDHLDRHYTMKNYTDVKMNIAKNQDCSDVCVLNYEDEKLRARSKSIKAEVMFFSSKRRIENGIYLEGCNIIYCFGECEELIIKTNEMHLVGIHSIENVMASVAICIKLGVPLDVIRNTIREFKAVEHRIEYVTEKEGIIYYNDSKGTNTDASKKAIEAMSRPTVLIAGGYDKDAEFGDWIDAFGTKIKKLILLGETKMKITKAAMEHGYTDIILVNTLKEAVEVAQEAADYGDAVLLSPACASWDMFKSYEERGTLFKDYVCNL